MQLRRCLPINLRDEILKLLQSSGIDFEYLKHEETPTSEDSARVRGTSLQEGVKAIVLRGKNTSKRYHFNIPSDKRLDMKKVAAEVGEKCEFEKAENLKTDYDLVPGAVPPFGNLMGLPTYYDEQIAQSRRAAFNCGLRSESIVMLSSDLIIIVKPVLGDFV